MLQTIIAVLSLIPSILAAVRSVEEAIPMSGQGKAKTDMILNIVQAAGDGANQMLPVVQKAIGIVVSTMNAVGVFKQA